MNAPASFAPMPDAQGFFGPYGGQLVPPHLKEAMDAINAAYAEITQRQDFQDELAQLFADYVGPPAPFFMLAACRSNWAERKSTSSAKISTTPGRTKSTTAWARRCWPNSWARKR